MQLGVGLSFPWHTFVIERMIWDKMVRLGFLGYNIDTDLPSEHKFLTFRLGASFIFFFKKKKRWRYNHAPKRRKNMHVLRGFSVFSFIEINQILCQT